MRASNQQRTLIVGKKTKYDAAPHAHCPSGGVRSEERRRRGYFAICSRPRRDFGNGPHRARRMPASARSAAAAGTAVARPLPSSGTRGRPLATTLRSDSMKTISRTKAAAIGLAIALCAPAGAQPAPASGGGATPGAARGDETIGAPAPTPVGPQPVPTPPGVSPSPPDTPQPAPTPPGGMQVTPMRAPGSAGDAPPPVRPEAPAGRRPRHNPFPPLVW